VCGHENELGYFSLSELQALSDEPLPQVERDLYYQEQSLRDVMQQENRRRLWHE